jgi:hypothetical protein
MDSEALGPQHYPLILIDLATVAAARAHGVNEVVEQASYVPGAIHAAWRENTDADLRQKVTALAMASSSSLTQVPAEQLIALATRYGFPLTEAIADRISTYYQNKRDAVLTYNH